MEIMEAQGPEEGNTDYASAAKPGAMDPLQGIEDENRTEQTEIPVDIIVSKTRSEPVPFKPPCHGIAKYLIPALLTLVALKYQDKAGSLFSEYTAHISCFLGATSIYWLIADVMKHMQTITQGQCFRTLHYAAPVSAAISAVSLGSTFFPPPFSIVLLVVGIFIAIILPLPVYGPLNTGIRRFLTQFHARMRNAGQCFGEEASLPV